MGNLVFSKDTQRKRERSNKFTAINGYQLEEKTQGKRMKYTNAAVPSLFYYCGVFKFFKHILACTD